MAKKRKISRRAEELGRAIEWARFKIRGYRREIAYIEAWIRHAATKNPTTAGATGQRMT